MLPHLQRTLKNLDPPINSLIRLEYLFQIFAYFYQDDPDGKNFNSLACINF